MLLLLQKGGEWNRDHAVPPCPTPWSEREAVLMRLPETSALSRSTKRNSSSCMGALHVHELEPGARESEERVSQASDADGKVRGLHVQPDMTCTTDIDPKEQNESCFRRNGVGTILLSLLSFCNVLAKHSQAVLPPPMLDRFQSTLLLGQILLQHGPSCFSPRGATTMGAGC